MRKVNKWKHDIGVVYYTHQLAFLLIQHSYLVSGV